jgi:hypothetical protein
MARAAEAKGKLRIGDDWNAIRIIALSQSNPLKAIAELVENSIDAHARKISPSATMAMAFRAMLTVFPISATSPRTSAIR